MRFNDLPEELRRLLFDLENYKVIEIIPDGIHFKHALFNQFQDRIFETHDKYIINYLKFLNGLPIEFFPYKSLLNNYNFKVPREKKDQDPISSGEEDSSKKKNTGLTGGSHPAPSSLGGRASEEVEYKNLSECPTYMVPEVLQKRKDDFGIWISQDALRHFESLSCSFFSNDKKKNEINMSIFDKLEKHFKPVYANNKWATPIDNKKREELGLSFGFQMHQKGHVRIHVKEKDVEKVTRNIFEVFKPCLTDEDIIHFIELLTLERSQKPVYKIHDARNIGPKKIIDEKFKGAHVKVNEVHWFGSIKYDVRVDYSKPMAPHVEGEGPVAQVGNFMKLIDGSPEFISNLSEIREVAYRTRDDVFLNTSGISQLSQMVSDNGQTMQLIQHDLIPRQDLLAEFSELGIQLDRAFQVVEINRDIETQKLINFMQEKVIPRLKTEFIQIGLEGSEERIQIRQALITLIKQLEIQNNDYKNQFQQLIINLLNLESSQESKMNNVQNSIENTIIDSSNEIIETSTKNKEIISGEIKLAKEEIKNVVKEGFNSLQQVIMDEFGKLTTRLNNNLYLVLRAINTIPGKTSKEIISNLQGQLNVSKRTLYNYLSRLQDKNLIHSNIRKNKDGPGRPSKIFSITEKTKKFIKKLNKKGVNFDRK